jgi:hypothetical protein
MTTVNRELVLNQYEPSTFSLRAPRGSDLTINTQLLDQNRNPYTADIEATILLTGRSSARDLIYAMPAVDIANGKIRAVIPGDELTDQNGYNVVVTGSLDGAMYILAQGYLMLAGKGVSVAQAETITNIPLTITRGNAITLDLKLWQDEGKNAQYLGASISAVLRTNATGPVVQEITVTPFGLPNEFRLTLTAEQTALLTQITVRYWEVVAVVDATAMTLLQGEVIVL